MRKFLLMISLILALTRGIWAIEPKVATAFEPIVADVLLGKPVSIPVFDSKRISSLSALHEGVVSPYSAGGGLNAAQKGSIAIIPLDGAVMKNDYCGAPGTASLAKWFAQADANPNIIGAILYCDSPGGDVSGTDLLADQIKNMSKPTVALVNGMMCSAAYWIGSACDHIMSDSPNNTIGSIGTYCTLRDMSGSLESKGIKVHEIYATKSTEKNKDYKDALDGNYDTIRNNQIDPINEQFHAAVRSNRYGKGMDYKGAFTGRTYQTNEAISKGLIDSAGKLSDAISLIQKMAKA